VASEPRRIRHECPQLYCCDAGFGTCRRGGPPIHRPPILLPDVIDRDRVLRCECGHEARATDEDGLVAEVRRHAWQAHRMALSQTDALQLTRRTQAPVRVTDDSTASIPEEEA
jgi:predicted small metal-binding protein